MRYATKANFALALAMTFANLSALALNFLLPGFLTPETYVKYSLLLSIAQFVVLVGYEPLRVNIIRYADSSDEPGKNIFHATLSIYKIVSVVLILTFFLLLVWVSQEIFQYICLIAGYALLQGSFDATQAIRRARFELATYSVHWVTRSTLSLLFALCAAYVWSTDSSILIALALSFASGIPFLITNSRTTRPDIKRDTFVTVLRYGWLISSASLASSIFVIWVKYVVQDAFSYEMSAGVILALDLSFKVMMAVGLAANIIFLQNSIRSIDRDTLALFKKKNKANLSFIAALIIPAGFGFYSISEYVVHYFVPAAYEPSYAENFLIVLLGVMVMIFRVYIVDTQFIVIARPNFALVGPVVTLAGFFVFWKVLGYFDVFGPIGISVAILFGALLGLVAAFLLVSKYEIIEWPYQGVIQVIVSSLVMILASRLVELADRLPELITVIVLSIIVYCASLVTLNFHGLGYRILASMQRTISGR